MTIESGHGQRHDSDAEARQAFADQSEAAMRDATAPDPEFQDNEAGAALRAENARLKDEAEKRAAADAKRKKRSQLIGGGTVAGLALVGGGIFVGSKLGGDTDPGTNPTPTAEAPANPTGESPVGEAPVEPSPGTSPTDLPNFDDIDPTDNPDFIDLGIDDNRYEASAEDILGFYAGLDQRWIEGTGVDAGVNYVANFLADRGARVPIIAKADTIIQEPGLRLSYRDPSTGESVVAADETMHESLTATLNTYLANKEELGLDISKTDPTNRHFFNAAGKYIVRGMAETLENPDLCYDQYDCLKAYENEDFRQIFQQTDSLPAGSAIIDVNIVSNLEGQGRYAKSINLLYKTPDSDSVEFIEISLNEGFTLYPTQFDSSNLQSSSTRAASLNQVYKGMPYGESEEAYLYLSNDEQIQEKIGNPLQQ